MSFFIFTPAKNLRSTRMASAVRKNKKAEKNRKTRKTKTRRSQRGGNGAATINTPVTKYFNYYKNDLTPDEISEARHILSLFKPGEIEMAVSKCREVYPEFKDFNTSEIIDQIIYHIKNLRGMGETVSSFNDYNSFLDEYVKITQEAKMNSRPAAPRGIEDEVGNSRVPSFLLPKTNPYSSGPPRKGWNEQYGQ